jgi:hypothetical protein
MQARITVLVNRKTKTNCVPRDQCLERLKGLHIESLPRVPWFKQNYPDDVSKVYCCTRCNCFLLVTAEPPIPCDDAIQRTRGSLSACDIQGLLMAEIGRGREVLGLRSASVRSP